MNSKYLCSFICLVLLNRGETRLLTAHSKYLKSYVVQMFLYLYSLAVFLLRSHDVS